MFLRRTFLRIFKLLASLFSSIVIIWIILVGLYISIPSPATSTDSGSLAVDRPIVRVFDSRFNNLKPEALDYDRDFLILEFKYVQDTTTGLQTLLFGGGFDLLDKINGFLEPHLRPNIPVPYHNISLNDFGSDISLSPPIEMIIPTGDSNGELIPDGIEVADAVLLFWWANHNFGSLDFRIRKVPDEKLVEIWPDSEQWETDDARNTPPAQLTPLVSITLDEPGSTPKYTFLPPSASYSPSSTYPLRMGMLLFILPVGAIGLLLFTAFQGIFHGLLEIAALLFNLIALGVVCVAIYGVYWWIRNQRPRMSVSLGDIRETLDSTLADIRARSEAREQARMAENLEAQIEVERSSKQDLEAGTSNTAKQ